MYPFSLSYPTPRGNDSTETVATTVVPEITVVVFEPLFATYAYPLPLSNPTPHGPFPTGTVAMTLPFQGQQDLSTFERVGKNLAVLPVHQHDPLRVAAFDKPNEVVVARVRAEVELLPLALDVDRDAI